MEEKIYADAALSFGLRSLPIIFTALADVATWGQRLLGVRYADHYLDELVTIGIAPVPASARRTAR